MAPGLEDVQSPHQLTNPVPPGYRPILTIPQGCVVGSLGPVLTPDQAVLYEHCLRWDEFHAQEVEATLNRYRHSKSEAITRLSGRAVCLNTIWSTVYFHWFMETVPKMRLLQLADLPFDHVIVPRPVLPFMLETLTRVGVSAEQVVECDRFEMIQADSLIVPFMPSVRDFPEPDVLQWIADLFPHPKERQLRIYWARYRSGNSRLVNETELFPILEKYGFQVFYPEDYTIDQQAAIVSQADVFLSVHCSGLTNIVFCPEGATVMEMIQQGIKSPVFQTMAKRLNLQYLRTETRYTEPGEKKSYHLPATISPERLEVFLNKQFPLKPTESTLYDWLCRTQWPEVRLDQIQGRSVIRSGLEGVPSADALRVWSPLNGMTSSEGSNGDPPAVRSVLHLPDGTALGGFGVFMTPDHTLIADHTITDRKLDPFLQAIAEESLKRPFRQLEGDAICLTAMWSDLYFHWLLEIFPRLMLLDLATLPYDYLLLSNPEPKFIKESLGKLGIPASKLVRCGEYDRVGADQLIIPSYVSPTPSLPEPDVLAWHREVFPPGAPNGQRVYLTAGSPGKGLQLANEAELFPVLTGFGFRIVHPQTLSISQFATLMGQSQIVITASSEHLTNLIFCPPETTVVEVLPPEQPPVISSYRRLAERANVAYLSLHAVSENNEISLPRETLIRFLLSWLPALETV